MVDLTSKPFNLGQEDIKWVNRTIESMSLDEKIGQLFINLGLSRDPEYIDNLTKTLFIGGVRYTEGSAKEIYQQNRYYQQTSKIPLLIASNCEEGGNGSCNDGTFIGTQAQCGACETSEGAYQMGYVAGKEASAVGCNWTFSPICDILFNWRNTIVNTRSFGSSADRVIEWSQAYIDGIRNSNVLTCAKHFPGDGVDDRDHHLLMSCNDLSCEDWDASFGNVYRALINHGVESIMAGHIALPAYSKKLRPGIKDSDIRPASMSPEILQDLLRKQLGFNGLILTDASHMAGLTGQASRRNQVVGAITAGCDMFLFFHNAAEDIGYVKEAYHLGILSNERLNDALQRILGLKAKLGLHNKGFADLHPEQGLQTIGCAEHLQMARMMADNSIALVKDTQNLLPLTPQKYKRIKLYYLESAPIIHCKGTDKTRDLVVSELECAGFDVTVNKSLYDYEQENSTPANKGRIMEKESVEEFKSTYDAVFVFVRMTGYAQENNVRVKFSASHSNEIPWWNHDVPTVCISLNYTNHLYDLPMMKTFINAFSPTKESIHACIEKITGKSEFKGQNDDLVWCSRWDTRI
jgi:beta-N-acetylhexosaminidase